MIVIDVDLQTLDVQSYALDPSLYHSSSSIGVQVWRYLLVYVLLEENRPSFGNVGWLL